eukprot:361005-Chlamydomonas_euryale.AAC.10
MAEHAVPTATGPPPDRGPACRGAERSQAARPPLQNSLLLRWAQHAQDAASSAGVVESSRSG